MIAIIRLTSLPASELDDLFLGTTLTCVYMHLAEQKDNWACTMHTHEYLEFGYIFKGAGLYHIDGIDYAAEAGDIFVIPPNTPHFEKHDPEQPFELLFIMIRYDGSDSGSKLEEVIGNMRGKHERLPEGTVKPLFDGIYHEIVQQAPGYLSVIDGKLKALLIALLRHDKGQETQVPPAKLTRGKDKRNEEVLRQLKLYIHEHLQRTMTAEELAHRFYYHPKYLSELFKAETGRSIASYVSELRLERAKERLKQGNEPVESIAGRLGFSSVQHFYKFFKNKIGMTPVAYRTLYAQAPQEPFTEPPNGGH